MSGYWPRPFFGFLHVYGTRRDTVGNPEVSA